MKETTIEVAFYDTWQKDNPPIFTAEVTYFGSSLMAKHEAIEQVKQDFIQDFFTLEVTEMVEEDDFNNEFYFTPNEDCHFDIWQYDKVDDEWLGTVLSEQVAELTILALEEAQKDGRI